MCFLLHFLHSYSYFISSTVFRELILEMILIKLQVLCQRHILQLSNFVLIDEPQYVLSVFACNTAITFNVPRYRYSVPCAPLLQPSMTHRRS